MITIGDICDSVREASRSNDFIVQRLHNGELQAIIYFFDTLCDTKVIRERISDPFATCATIEAFTECFSLSYYVRNFRR